MLLEDPYDQTNDTSKSAISNKSTNPSKVDISLELSAYGNATKYFVERKHAKRKEDKTIEASGKALKSAQIKTAKAMKEVQIKSSIIKSRKVLWFEKFYFFISSENYIVIGGKDAQQNEMIVKRYLRQGDLYVHADLNGASSVVIKNRSSKNKIPSKTIEEAGCFAVCYSVAWESKTPIRAWYVNSDQVSKTAPSGEYLTIGSFMIRGKKNYLPLTILAMGFSFFFRLNEESIVNHLNDRKVKYVENEDNSSMHLEEKIKQQAVEQPQDENVFPDTMIRLSRSEKDQDMILEAMIPRAKVQRKLKNLKQDKKSANVELNDKSKQQLIKQQSANNQKKQKGKGKKTKKGGDWSDDEEKILSNLITIKLEKKLEKDNRLQDLDNQTKMMISLNDEEELSDEEENEELIDNQEANESNQQNEQADGEILETYEQANQTESSESGDEKVAAVQNEEEESEEEPIEEETNDERREAEYLKLVNSLTGQPLAEDLLMYCIPIVAPYNAVVNCKYKVKVLPGQNKRGRSAKTALQLFLLDKKITSRERDLIKSMKDQDIARNLPNKLKVTAQHLQQVKRKK